MDVQTWMSSSEASERGDIGDLVAFDHVAQEQHVDVALEELTSLRHGQILGFGEAADFHIAGEMVVERGSLAVGQRRGIYWNFLLMMAKKFAKAEGMNGNFPARRIPMTAIALPYGVALKSYPPCSPSRRGIGRV